MVATLGKPAWRERLRSARAAVTPEEHAAAAAALARRVADLRGTVCAYRPIGGEPGSAAMLTALRDAGCRVLLPVVVRGRPLDWAEYTGESGLAPAGYGLLEPTGPRLGAAAIGTADVVLVPALAVDRSGVRLGQGGGYYDRSLPLAAPGARLIAVVGDHELLPSLPREPHDVLVTEALTPSSGFVALG
ncbi:MAG TPA: 5-formyltetrahydrofolate cyclo-ligase [Pseudonocardiaceae bacterium]